MPRYRVHILDASGKVIGAGQFDCVNNEVAQERIGQLAGGLDTELWQLVASVGSGTTPRSLTSEVRPRTRRRLHS